jgi:hypothetical protein
LRLPEAAMIDGPFQESAPIFALAFGASMAE